MNLHPPEPRTSGEVNYYQATIQEMQSQIATLNNELATYKNAVAATTQSYTFSHQTPSFPPTCSAQAASMRTNRMAASCAQSAAASNRPAVCPTAYMNLAIAADASKPNNNNAPGAAPVCLCGVNNLQEENMRLRQGLMAKYNEVMQLRGLMSSRDSQTPAMHMIMAAADHRLPAGGTFQTEMGTSCPRFAPNSRSGNRGFSSSPVYTQPSAVSARTSAGAGPATFTSGNMPCMVPCCPHQAAAAGCVTDNPGLSEISALAFCDTSQSASAIIQQSKRQMEQTENEIKHKLHEIKGKKNELEEDIAKLQKVLLAKQHEASSNMQAARAAKACEIAQAAHMAIELQKQQRAQAQEAARAAMQLQYAQDEQSRKQAMAAKAAQQAQQAQYHQLATAAQAAAAAERAEEAQKEQATQADEAARAAEAVKVAQEEQTRLATKQLQDAETLKRNQEEQACKTAQATEALHAAHVAQVAQHAQACQATTQAHSVLTQHKYIPPTMGCEELERSMHPNMASKCCNPNCPRALGSKCP